MQELRCPNCNKKLGNLEGIAEIKCPRCGKVVRAVVIDLKNYDYDVMLIDEAKNT